MAVMISNTYLYSPKLSSSFRTTTFHNQSYNHTKWFHYNLKQYTGLITCKSSSSANRHGGNGGGDFDATEESRWLREEQRWLREERRWLREEARWNAERNSLLLQIQHLQSQLDRLRRVRNDDSVNLDVNFVVDDVDDDSASKTLVKMAALLKEDEDEEDEEDEDEEDEDDEDEGDPIFRCLAKGWPYLYLYLQISQISLGSG